MRGFRNGLAHLEASCEYMKESFELYGRPKSRSHAAGFATIVRIIIDQQVSVHAGAAIWRRLSDAAEDVSANRIIRLGESGLRASGISGPKSKYIIGIAEKIVSGELDLARLSRRRDETVRNELMALKGVGEWTADVYLMFALGRRDVFPVADIALQAAAGSMLGLPQRPSPNELREISERWRPYRSVAAIALWHFYKKMPAT